MRKKNQQSKRREKHWEEYGTSWKTSKEVLPGEQTTDCVDTAEKIEQNEDWKLTGRCSNGEVSSNFAKCSFNHIVKLRT